jgi:hypothetical protein
MTEGLDVAVKQMLADRLREAFPDASFDDCDLEGVALAMQHNLAASPPERKLFGAVHSAALDAHKKTLDALAATLPHNANAPNGRASSLVHEADPITYYWTEATHTRQTPEGYQPFVGELAMVRASLPEREPRRFNTVVGTIEPSDHLLATVYEANDKYQKALGYPLARLDVITPPRQLLRFGAISVYLGYRSATGMPSCYILEAGTALGQPKVLYLGKTIATKINRISGYQPTAFSCSDNAYTGEIQLNGHEPVRLHITARDLLERGTKSAAPYMDLNVRFTKQTGSVQSIWPGFLIARAALIVLERQSRGLENTCEDT